MVDFTPCEEEYRKACGKYRVAKPDVAIVKRRWRIFLAVEAVLLTCFVSLFMFAKKSELTPVFASILGPLLAFSLPVAVLYLVGRPPVMSLDPDGSSPETRAMESDVGSRVPLSDDDFYTRFYNGSGIARDTIARIRHRLRKNIDPASERLVPTDYLPLLWDGLDFADLFYAIEREFGATLPRDATFNGTLDGLIRVVQSQIEGVQAVGSAALK
jgi:hypothetical protein